MKQKQNTSEDDQNITHKRERKNQRQIERKKETNKN